MGKQGPCCHCNISTTPLWRNGPPEKPVLCNACGSRWRTKGTLENYMPMHSGGFGGAGCREVSGDAKRARGRKGAHKPSSEHQSHRHKEPSKPCESLTPLKRKDSFTISDSGWEVQSSSQPAPLATESTVHGSLWEGSVPTKKRTMLFRTHAPSDKVARHLFKLLHEPPPSDLFTTSCTSSKALLVEYNPPFAAFEVGLGSNFLNRPLPTSAHQEPEGETNSVGYERLEGSESLDDLNQVIETRSSGPLTQLPNGTANNLVAQGKERLLGQKIVHREKFPYNKRDVLQSCQSPLVLLEMKDIVNFDTFKGLLTEEEQSQLMKFVSSVDLASIPDSLKDMFNSTQFEGAFANFQQLVSEGMFDSAEVGLNHRVLQHFQQLLNITDLSGSGWIERCFQLQHRSKRGGKPADFSKKHTEFAGNLSPVPSHETSAYGGLEIGKHSQSMNMSTCDIGSSSTEGGYELDTGETCFLGAGMLLADQGCGEGPISVDDLPDIQVPGLDGTEPDLLFHIPSNMMSFQQAELLQRPTCKEEMESNQVVENGSLILGNTWHMDSSPADWGSLFYNPSCAGPGCALPNGTVLNPGQVLL
ncbi:unnamed protein product [Sphagnum troendelagicum]